MKSNAKEFNLRPVGTKHNLSYTVKLDNSWSNIKINNIHKDEKIVRKLNSKECLFLPTLQLSPDRMWRQKSTLHSDYQIYASI